MNKLFFDLETTSADITTAKIIQLALLETNERDEKIMEKSNLINPKTPILESATAVHGITDEMVKDKPVFDKYAKSLKKLFENKILVGYNILQFDIPILLSEFDRAGVKVTLSGKFIDVMKVETKLAPRTLSAIYKKYTNSEIENAHDALGDVKATRVVLSHQEKIIKDSDTDLDLLDALQEMSGMKDVVDYYGKLKYDEDKFLIYNFGKNVNKRVVDFPEYANYIFREPFPQQVKDLIREEQLKHTRKTFKHVQ